MGVQRREEAKAPIPGARVGGGTSLSERRIKTLHISPYSSKTWRVEPAKVLIPKDWPWRGVVPHYLPVNTKRRKMQSSQATAKKFIFGRTNGESCGVRAALQVLGCFWLAALSCRAMVTAPSMSAAGAGLPVQISNCLAACCTNISIPGITAIPLARATCSR